MTTSKNETTMAKISLAKAKKQIIAKIKRKGGLYENLGEHELWELQAANDFACTEDYMELYRWIESLDYDTVQKYL